MLYAISKINLESWRAIDDANEIDALTEQFYTGDIAAYQPDSLVRNKLKQELSDLAANKIAAIFGKPAKSMDLLIKELNLSNRCNELINTAIVRTLTADEQAELDIYNGYWSRVKMIRLYEKQRSFEVDSADLTAFDINAGWPE